MMRQKKKSDHLWPELNLHDIRVMVTWNQQ